MKIGVAGYTGRVGQLLVKEILSGGWKGMDLSAASSRSVHPEYTPQGSFSVYTDPDDLMQACDCVVDFTTPESTLKNISAAVKYNTSMVIGTTGFSDAQLQELKKASKTIPVVFAANMSVGVNLLMALVEQAAARLNNGWDIEIFESHHKNKIDAPSGTALALGQSAQKGRGTGAFVTDRGGKRSDGDIGYAVSRGGDVVGEHMVTFYGMGERVELGHKATDRALFARGALKAAEWLDSKPPGLYSMRDVLEL